MPAPSPLINGHRYDWSSIEIVVAGQRITGITAISYSNTLEPGIVRGIGARPLGRTRGEFSAEASFSMLKSDYGELIRALDPTGGAIGYMEAYFTINVSYAERFEKPQNDVLIGCRITSDEESHSPSADALVVNVTLSVDRIMRNGQSPVDLRK